MTKDWISRVRFLVFITHVLGLRLTQPIGVSDFFLKVRSQATEAAH